MKNRDLAIKRLERIEGKLKALEVLATRPTTTVKDIHEISQFCCNEIEDLKTMIEREPVNYGR